MRIEVEVSHFYDWEELSPGTEVQTDEIGRPFLQDGQGRPVPVVSVEKGGRTAMARRVLHSAQEHRGQPTTTTIVEATDAQVQRMVDDFNQGNLYTGRTQTRLGMLAKHLEENVMQFHAPADRWVALDASDAEAADFLRGRFGLTTPRPMDPGGGPATGNEGGPRERWRLRDATTSLFSSRHMRGSRIIRDWNFRPNLRTNPTAGTGVIGGVDWEAALMGNTAGYTGTGANVSYTATTLTDTGAAFPTAGAGLTGRVVVVGSVWGVCVKNTATVITVDEWQSVTSPGSSGATPAAQATYTIPPGCMAPIIWLALSSDVTAPASTDQYLTSEFVASGSPVDTGLVRTLATYAHTLGQTSFTLSHTFTSAAAVSSTVNKEAAFASPWDGSSNWATSGTSHGPMIFESAEPSPPTLVSGDTLAQSVTVST